MNIILVGFTSSGKTVTGKALAVALDYRFLDLDAVVEKLHTVQGGQALKCREIYRLVGRSCFVSYEAQALTELSVEDRIVLSTGGGAPVDSNNRRLLKAMGKVVYLKTSPEVIFERMKKKGLPQYLQPDPSLSHLKQHWQGRHEIYKQLSSCKVDNSDLTVEETVDAVRECLQLDDSRITEKDA